MNKNDNMYGESREQENEMQNNPRTVSYTHLTLPTNSLV